MMVLFSAALSAQTEEKKLSYNYPQKVSPEGIDNYLFSTYYYNGKKTYNMRGAQLSSSAPIAKFRINPSGSSFAILEVKGEQGSILVYNLWKANKIIKKIECQGYKPLAVCYSPDSRLLAVSGSNQSITVYDTRDYQAQQRFETSGSINHLEISGNNYFLAGAEKRKICIWNLQNGQLRQEMSFNSDITDIAFSNDNKQLGVLTDDGNLTTYDTQQFNIKQVYDALGEARSFYYHKDGKYAAVVTGDKRIAILNLLNLREREYVDEENGGIKDLRFLNDNKKDSYLAYSSNNAIVYAFMNQLSPYYTRLIADELHERMTEWLKQRPNETLEDYNIRVNDESRAEQMKLFEREIATRLADNLIDKSEIKLGSYNDKEGLLALNFDSMPNIYLNVPEKDLSDFSDPGLLEFRNAVYGVNNEDCFELIYADVYNKKNGKTYVFNNLERQSLAYLENDENFVPLEIIQQSNAEELKLQEIKQGIIDLAKRNKKITDNTEISVSATAESGFDANGKRITNYNISFAYKIEQQYSAKEDFASGHYRIEESAAAMSMLEIVREAFTKDMSSYIVPGKQLKISITGMADASPINKAIAYDGCYGEYEDEPVYKDGNLTAMTLNKTEGVATNEQLAFLRALGVKHHIEQTIDDLKKMNCSYSYNIDLASKTGGQYRRISVVFTFIDAFK